MREEEIIQLVKTRVTKKFVMKYFQTISREELISEAYYWLSSKGRIKKITEIYEDSPAAATTYIDVSLDRLFTRKLTNKLFRDIHEGSHQGAAEKGEEKQVKSGITFATFESGFQNIIVAQKIMNDPRFKSSITPVQREALELIYVQKMTQPQAAEKLGISTRAFYDRRKKGLKNLFLSIDYHTRG